MPVRAAAGTHLQLAKMVPAARVEPLEDRLEAVARAILLPNLGWQAK